MPKGRPRIVIDKQQFENACELQCTLTEIAFLCKCSEDTIERWCKREFDMGFADIYKKYSAGGKISLRRSQFKLSEKNAAMAIFLGKQYLGQQDIIENINTERRREELREIFWEVDGGSKFDTEKIFTEQTAENDNS